MSSEAGAISPLETSPEAERVAAADVNVLIGGETGTGKGRLAQALHGRSQRAERPFVAVDCAALPPSLFESQLFGHVKGAFTGAVSARTGLIRSAHQGTLFLDEIGELAPEQQAGLLTFIQDRTVLPVGGTDRVECDVRLMAATHRDLEAMVSSGAFREDLFYRLAVVEVSVPPLRERRHELPELVADLIERKAELLGVEARKPTSGFMEALARHDWPGNIRELGNCIERALVLSRGPFLEESALPKRMTRVLDVRADAGASGGITQDAVRSALQASAGRKAEAARRLGISRRHLYRLLPSDEDGRASGASARAE